MKLNPLFTERTRLLIMATLAASPKEVDFTTLVQNLDLTRGNLSAHIKKLEEAGFVKMKKEFVDRKSRTSFRATSKGRREVKKYLEEVERILNSIK